MGPWPGGPAQAPAGQVFLPHAPAVECDLRRQGRYTARSFCCHARLPPMLTIYHNPRCSKSREALALIEAAGHQPEVIDYLKTPPDAATLKRLLKALGISARELLRRKEAEYDALGLDDARL
ncbi:MAG: ArsC/Spx/MgsR family protein, partial [Moraxellaceae bacterium]